MNNLNSCEFLYSINSFLAYKINEKYYKGKHYCWCAPKFNCTENPPSSNPKEIMKCLKQDVELQDRHSFKIGQNRLGLLSGIEIKYTQNIINAEQRLELIKIVNNADIIYFRPLIYVISFKKVKNKIIRVNCDEKAEWFSEEYKIEELMANEFDIIDIF